MEAPRQKLINESATVVATTTFGDVTLSVFFSAIIVKLKTVVRENLGASARAHFAEHSITPFVITRFLRRGV
jgi:hypothetical protein